MAAVHRCVRLPEATHARQRQTRKGLFRGLVFKRQRDLTTLEWWLLCWASIKVAIYFPNVYPVSPHVLFIPPSLFEVQYNPILARFFFSSCLLSFLNVAAAVSIFDMKKSYKAINLRFVVRSVTFFFFFHPLWASGCVNIPQRENRCPYIILLSEPQTFTHNK